MKRQTKNISKRFLPFDGWLFYLEIFSLIDKGIKKYIFLQSKVILPRCKSQLKCEVVVPFWNQIPGKLKLGIPNICFKKFNSWYVSKCLFPFLYWALVVSQLLRARAKRSLFLWYGIVHANLLFWFCSTHFRPVKYYICFFQNSMLLEENTDRHLAQS